FAMLFFALGLAVPITSAIVAQVTLLFMYLLPAAPGYVGSLEAGGTLLLTSIGLAPGAAVGAIVLWHVVATAGIVGLGVVALHRVLRASKTGCGAREEAAPDRPARCEICHRRAVLETAGPRPFLARRW